MSKTGEFFMSKLEEISQQYEEGLITQDEAMFKLMDLGYAGEEIEEAIGKNPDK